MRYERPAIVRRESIVGLATVTLSDVKQPPDGGVSDVHKKDNIVPVAWAGEVVAYEAPAVSRRDVVAGLADTAASDTKPDAQQSDVNLKDNVVPVRW